jgi:hypothetical protein
VPKIGPDPIFYFLEAISAWLAIAIFVTVPSKVPVNTLIVAIIDVAAPSTSGA